MYHHGWMWTVEPNGIGREIFNNARTAAYLENSDLIGCGRITSVLGDAGCRAYRFAPPCINDVVLAADDDALSTNDDFAIQVSTGHVTADGWIEHIYVSPADDPAPWYNPTHPESAEFLGFWVEEWTGLDSGHVQRPITQVGAYRGGGQFGPAGNNYREMGIQLILLGGSERALEYGFRWLEATLASVCFTCATDSVLIRRFCPDVDADPESASDGVVEMRGVGLLTSLSYGGPPVEQAQCHLRRVEFTLAAEDPCLYSVRTGVMVDQVAELEQCLADAFTSTGRSACRPSCSELGPECRTVYTFDVDTVGAAGVVATFRPYVNPAAMLPFRARVYADPLGLGGADPCGLPLIAELMVAGVPSDSELIWDMAGRQVLWRGAETGGPIGGFQFLEPNTVGVPRFAGLGCGVYHLVIEPNTLCLNATGTPGVYQNAAGETFDARPGDFYVSQEDDDDVVEQEDDAFPIALHVDNPGVAFPVAEVFVQERMGCV